MKNDRVLYVVLLGCNRVFLYDLVGFGRLRWCSGYVSLDFWHLNHLQGLHWCWCLGVCRGLRRQVWNNGFYIEL